MANRVAVLIGAVTLGALAYGCEEAGSPTAPARSNPEFAASGTQGTVLGRSTFGDTGQQTFKLKRITGDWHLELKAKPRFDLAVQRIVFQPGGQSGWHTHPGPVFIQVVSGAITFYESDDPTCKPIVRGAGEGYLDLGEHAHLARNETGTVAENVVTYLVPPGAALRNDADPPGNCPF
jgi:hypothetical protein